MAFVLTLDGLDFGRAFFSTLNMKLTREIPIDQIKNKEALTLEQFGFTLVESQGTLKIYVEEN